MKKGKIVSNKPKFNPFTKKLMMNRGGFPDFIAIKYLSEGKYEIIGVEVKMNGLLSKEEKEKCRWYLNNNIFSKILVAKKGENRGSIEYIDFLDKWKREKEN